MRRKQIEADVLLADPTLESRVRVWPQYNIIVIKDEGANSAQGQ